MGIQDHFDMLSSHAQVNTIEDLCWWRCSAAKQSY